MKNSVNINFGAPTLNSSILSMSRQAILSFLFLIFSICSVNAEVGTQLPYESWSKLHTEFHEKQCNSYAQLHKQALLNPLDKNNSKKQEEIKNGQQFYCDCAPAALSAYNAALSTEVLTRNISLQDFTSRIKPAISNQCTAALIRSSSYESCLVATFPLPDGMTDRASFCDCLARYLASTPDHKISDAAESAQAELDEASETLSGKKVSNVHRVRSDLTNQMLKACK